MMRTTAVLVVLGVYGAGIGGVQGQAVGAVWGAPPDGPASGWVHQGPGWEDVQGMAAWGAKGWAVGLDVYDADGNAVPQVAFAGPDGVIAEANLEAEGHVAGAAGTDTGDVWVAWRSVDSSPTAGTTSLGKLGRWSGNAAEGAPIAPTAVVNCPWRTPWMQPEDVVAVAGGAVVAGWGLDPCCTHRELPLLWKVDANGQPDLGFGHGGLAVVDLVAHEVIRPPGHSPLHEASADPLRHEIGGFFACSAPAEAGFVAGGGYANGSSYELLVVRFTDGGMLDTGFGNQGIVHLNANPGTSHWISNLRCIGDRIVALVTTHAGGDLEPGCVVWSLDASGQTIGWEEVASDHGIAQQWVAAQGELWAIAVSEDPTDPVIGFPWAQGFGPPSAWPRPPGVAWNGAQAAWNPRSHVLGLAYRCLDPVNASCEWGMRTWSPWAETRLHK